MNAPRDLLDRIRVASPCTASWEDMEGDARQRFCGDCRLHVYDLSAMRRDEAIDLLRGATGRVCARFARRPDGTVVTRDCGPVLRVLARRARRLRAIAATLLGTLASLALAACGQRGDRPDAAGSSGAPPAVGTSGNPLNISIEEGLTPPRGEGEDVLMGDIDVECLDPAGQWMGQVAVPESVLGRVAPVVPPADPEGGTPQPQGD